RVQRDNRQLRAGGQTALHADDESEREGAAADTLHGHLYIQKIVVAERRDVITLYAHAGELDYWIPEIAVGEAEVTQELRFSGLEVSQKRDVEDASGSIGIPKAHAALQCER